MTTIYLRLNMDNRFQNSNNRNWYIKGVDNYNDKDRPIQRETSNKINDDDLIIEENTIYEIDIDCVERLKRNRKR